MKALTVRQPWADLIIRGDKRIETRGWRTLYRGELAIHSAVTFGPAEREMTSRVLALDITGLALGCVIGTVELVDCKRVEDLDLSARERLLGDFTPGRFGWALANPRRFKRPIRAAGKLSLWEWDS